MRNDYTLNADGTVTIYIRYKGVIHHAIIDSEDLQKVSGATAGNWTLQVRSGRDTLYAGSFIHGRTVQMHTVVMGTPAGMVVDHWNHNGLDNRKTNLRITTQRNNTQNRRPQRNNPVGVSGISWNSRLGKWKVCPQIDRKRHFLGYYRTVTEAKLVLQKWHATHRPEVPFA